MLSSSLDTLLKVSKTTSPCIEKHKGSLRIIKFHVPMILLIIFSLSGSEYRRPKIADRPKLIIKSVLLKTIPEIMVMSSFRSY